MCGIVGRAGALKLSDERVFKTLLLLDWFRGQDSTGMAVISKQKNVDVLKVADDPIILMQHAEFESTMVGDSDAIWIGHNRASTVGRSTRANAHPFECDHITGVHNGTLTKDGLKVIAERVPEYYETDSETIFAHIALYGVDATIPLLEGAWALVWYDSIEESLNMIRNDQRPLFTCITNRGGTNVLTWASEYKMIMAARDMADDDGELVVDDEGYAYWPLPTDTLHTWDFKQIMQGDFKAETRFLAGKPQPPKVVTTMGASNNGYKAPELVKDNYEIVDVEEEEQDGMLFGGALEKAEWDRMVAYGCSYCGVDVTPDMDGLLIFPNEGICLCPSCSGETKTSIQSNFSAIENLTNLLG